ncbi:M16 family metallopeptidase [Rudanella lutea]|uniref:M16 family metallopeptidase n=1 Tax=Rudanella lutea TaxID=451374 RepID=UPI0003A9F7FB|nr:pitrilysin family protein [Rudanella lutea]
MLLDRTQSPSFQAIHEVRLPAVQSTTLANGLPVHLVSVHQQPVMRIECIFDAGTWYENGQAGAAFFAMKMLAEGTAGHSSAQISEYFDRYGAFLELNAGPDRCSVVVYCLTRHLADVLPMVKEMLTEPVFPEKEFEDLRNITLQNLRVNLEKNAYVAGVLFRENLFGKAHPYGRTQRPEVVEQITRTDIAGHFDRTIRNRPFQVLLAGHVTEAEVALVDHYFGSMTFAGSVTDTETLPELATSQPVILAEKAESLQSSIRMGRRLFTRDHPDFFPMLVTNELLGGYFGSRLMKNIREEKGFTYGISSNLISFRHEGYFLIGTDVKKEFTQQTLDETRKEIRRLQTELVPADELETVKNFMAGEFVGSLNTPFEIADRYKLILLDGLPTDFLTNYVANIRSVSAETIAQMATRYLTENDLIEVVVGGK